MTDAAIGMIVTSASSFAAIALKMFMDIHREKTAREWDMAQREFDRAERIRVAAELKADQQRLAAEVVNRQEVVNKIVVAKIDQNTGVNEAALLAAEKAYSEANSLSQKIHQSGLELRSPSRQTDHARQTDHIEEVVVDTNVVVHKLDKRKSKVEPET